jgi:hypothetical protein
MLTLLGYASEGIQQIVAKFQEEKKAWQNSQHQQDISHSEDLTTRVFLRYINYL